MVSSPHRARLLALWDLGLGWHVGVALLLLLGLAAYVQPSQGCIFDEGAYVLLAKALAEHDSWIVPDQARWIDPSGESNPLWPGGTALNRRHPFYPWLLSVLYRVFGTFGFILPSVLGTVLAGVSAWLLLGSLPDRWRRAGFWMTVLFTPLLVYSPLIFAHTLGAGAGGIAVYALLKWTSGSGRRWLALGLVSSALLFAVRTEGVLLIAALGAVIGVEAVRNRSVRARNVFVAVATGALFLAVRLVEQRVRLVTVGSAYDGGRSIGDIPEDSLALKAFGIFKTLLGFGGPTKHWTNFAVLVSALMIPVICRRLRDGQWRMAACLGLVPALSYASWALSGQRMFVSGLILTAPFLWFGVWGIRKDRLNREGVLLGFTALLFLTGVLLTQYPQGSGLEWGGRYLAVGLPVFAALSVTGLASVYSAAPQGAKRVVTAVGVGMSLLILAVGVDVLKTFHVRTRESAQLLTRFGEQADVRRSHPINGNKPILLTNHFLFPVIHWPDFERFNWVQVRERAPQFYLQRLREHKIDGFILVETANPKDAFGPFLERYGYSVRESKASRTHTVYRISSGGG